MVAGNAGAARWHETSDGRCPRPVATQRSAWCARGDGRLPHGSGGAGGRCLRSRRRSHGRRRRRAGATGQRERLGPGRQPGRERHRRTGQQRRRKRGRGGQRERRQRPGGSRQRQRLGSGRQPRRRRRGDPDQHEQRRRSERWHRCRSGDVGVDRGWRLGAGGDSLSGGCRNPGGGDDGPGPRRTRSRRRRRARPSRRRRRASPTTRRRHRASRRPARTRPPSWRAPRPTARSALGVTASPSGASAPGGVTATAAAARAPAASATGDGASAAGANASPSGASAPGAPDTWTWVWNWTGACLDGAGQRSARGLELGVELDVRRRCGSCRRDKFEPRRAGAGRDAHRRAGQPRRPCRRHADRARAGRAPARRVASTGGTAAGPPPARPPPAAGAVDAHAALLHCPGPKRRSRTSPPGCAPLRRPRAPILCASAVGGAAPAAADRESPFAPDPTVPAPRGLVRGRRGHRLRPPPDHGPAGRRVAGRPRRVELARRNGDPQRPGQDRPKDRSAGLAPSL